MRWSKLKSRIEDGFADSVAGRVEIWSTCYRGAHDEIGEVWLTFDSKRVYSMGTATYFKEEYRRAEPARAKCAAADHIDYLAAMETIDQALVGDGVLSQWHANEALFDYLNMSYDEILASPNPLVRALGVFDRRFGKHRLIEARMEGEHDLVRQCHAFRCACEGIILQETTASEEKD